MASSLSIISIYSTVDADHPAVWFETFDDTLNSVCAHIVLLTSYLLPFLFFFMLVKSLKELKQNWFFKMVIDLLEDFDFKNKHTKGYVCYQLTKRFLQLMAILLLDD